MVIIMIVKISFRLGLNSSQAGFETRTMLCPIPVYSYSKVLCFENASKIQGFNTKTSFTPCILTKCAENVANCIAKNLVMPLHGRP
jgi:hypothetical protein